MKKTLILVIITALFLISCATTGNQEGRDILSKIGQDGDFVVCVKGDDRISSVYVQIGPDSINGVVLGRFNKLEGVIAYNQLNLDNFDIYQPSKGVLYFSTENAKDFYKHLSNKVDYLSPLDLSLMLNSDISVYSVKPDVKIDKLFFSSVNNVFDLTIESNEADSLMRLLKADYVSFLTKSGISYDIKELSGHFIKNGDTVKLINLDTKGAINLWTTLKKDCFQQFSLVEF